MSRFRGTSCLQGMKDVRALTFDCAQTLIAVDWKPAVHIVECATAAGVELNPIEASGIYDSMLKSQWSVFRDLNLSGKESLVDEFWFELTRSWLDEIGVSRNKEIEIRKRSDERLFGNNSEVFSIYQDVRPCLAWLSEHEYKLGVISNWDISLSKTLRAFGIDQYFQVITASMVLGIEKPDPRIFEYTLLQMGVSPKETLHIGDNPLDDFRGARSAGLRSLVLDRSKGSTPHVYLNSLDDLPSRLLI